MSAEWMADAACTNTDPELFYPPSEGPGNARQIDQAKAVCRRCPVREDCLIDNIDDQWAVVGGTTPKERARIQRRLGTPPPERACGEPDCSALTPPRGLYCPPCAAKRRGRQARDYEEQRQAVYGNNTSRLGERRAS